MPLRAPRTQIAPWRQRVEQDPYDGEAWQALIAELAALPSSPELLLERRALYDEFLTHFPTAVSFIYPGTWAPASDASITPVHVHTMRCYQVPIQCKQKNTACDFANN